MRAITPRRRTTSRARLLDATRSLLDTGLRVTDLPVERIVGTANVSRSTFYQWFPDKTALIAHVAEPSFAEFRELCDLWWKRADWGSPQRLCDVITAMFDLALSNRHVWIAYLDQVDADRTFAGKFHRMIDAYTAAMAGRIAREQSDGRVPREVNPAQTARFIVTMTRAGIIDVLSSDTGDASERAAYAGTLARAIWLTMYAETSGVSQPPDERPDPSPTPAASPAR